MRSAIVVVLLTAACGKERDAPIDPQPTTPPAAMRLGLPDGPRGSITGTVVYADVPPAPHRIDRSSDPACEPRDIIGESIVVNDDGTLRNALVRVVGTDLRAPPPTEPVVITQRDCIYRPRVQGAVDGQEIEVRNADQTVHNVHGYDLGTQPPRALYNEAQLAGAPPIRKSTAGRAMVKLACDIHPWMVGYVVVSPHPLFAVTGDDGSFRIDGVPAGTHAVEVWHETLGTRVTEVTVAPAAVSRIELALERSH